MAKTLKQKHRDFAKFAAGLVVADFITAWWLTTTNLLPIEIWGTTITTGVAYFGMAFDVLLFILLVHYAWHPSVLEPNISRSNIFLVIGVLLSLVAAAHIARLAFGWSFTIGSWEAPFWLSWLGALVTAYIAYVSFHFTQK